MAKMQEDNTCYGQGRRIIGGVSQRGPGMA